MVNEYKFKWIGLNGFVDANLKGLAMAGAKVLINDKDMILNRPLQTGDTITIYDGNIASMLRANGNYIVVNKYVKPQKQSKGGD